MKKGIGFIKNNIVTGLLVIVPIAVICVILAGAIKKLIAVTVPITSKLSLSSVLIETILAVVLVVAILAIFFFIGGLVFQTYLGKSLNKWLEDRVLNRIPVYKTIKGVTRQFAGIEKGNHAIAEVDLYGNNNKLLGLLTDTLPDGRYVVYIPFAPVLSIGQVHIVPKEQVELLDISLKAATDIVSKLGFGANDLYNEKKETASD